MLILLYLFTLAICIAICFLISRCHKIKFDSDALFVFLMIAIIPGLNVVLLIVLMCIFIKLFKNDQFKTKIKLLAGMRENC